MVHPSVVAVIDIGSNSIKVLVAARARQGVVEALKYRTIDARISAGLSQNLPRLSEAGIVRGIDAIKTLLADVASFSPDRIVLAATSAVRDAENGGEFRERVLAATGHHVRILSGQEEANLIGRGLTCDPDLAHLRDFYVFDLGGGSLECLAFQQRETQQVASLQLGCVRLTEKFVADSAGPFDRGSRDAIMRHTRDVLGGSGFKFSLPAGAEVVGTGGTLTTVRAVLAARAGRSLEQSSTTITVADLRELLAWLGPLALAERKHIAGLPPGRADIFPAALATVIALAETAGFSTYRNSTYNLRFGLAAEALGG